MRDRKTGRIIWYLFSAVLIKWGVEIAVATFALSCGLHSNMGIGAISSIITIPMIGWIYRIDTNTPACMAVRLSLIRR